MKTQYHGVELNYLKNPLKYIAQCEDQYFTQISNFYQLFQIFRCIYQKFKKLKV